MHCNLYYLFKEDQAKHPLDPRTDQQILDALMLLSVCRPPEKTDPPTDPDTDETYFVI